MTRKEALRENDVFRWGWSEKFEKNHWGDFRGYHCKSRIAIVRGGKLLDTYWSDSGDRAVDLNKVDLAHLGNLDDYELLEYRNAAHFDPKDVLDLRHANSSSHPTLAPIYLRKGAKKSASAIAEHLAAKLAEAERERDSAARQVENIRSMMAKVQTGKIEGVWL